MLFQSKDVIVSLVDRLVASKIDSEVVQMVFDGISLQCDGLVQAFLASPKEFWRIFSIFTGLLHLPETNLCYSMVLKMFCEIGARMTEEDAFLSCGLFGDYGLPKIVPLLKTKPSKRKGLLGMTYFFCETTMHLRVIKALQDSLDDMDCFMQCIVILMVRLPHYKILHLEQHPIMILRFSIVDMNCLMQCIVLVIVCFFTTQPCA